MTNAQSISTISSLKKHYSNLETTPSQIVKAILESIEKRNGDGIWTYLVPAQELLKRAKTLEQIDSSETHQFPLWGIPSSLKDCIDVAGIPTTCACPEFAYLATHTNPVVQKLLDAGAILIGKTNLDQFSTGLVGIRTGYDVPCNAFAKDYIAGGSSSGAALSVAHGLVPFAIGTDTGGSGRVPAGFNNIVGLKPSRGLLSTSHMVDACRTLDCVSIFTLTPKDAKIVLQVAKGFNANDPFSRPESLPSAHLLSYQPNQSFSFGVPASGQREFFGNFDVESLFEEAIATLKAMGGICIEVDYTPFLQANDLLFNGAWVAERYASVGKFVETHPEAVVPVTRQTILKAKDITATKVFEGLYAVAELKRKIEALWETIDIFVVPTTGTIYRISEVLEDPISLNANLGYYTNFVNLLDLTAIAIPNGFQRNGIPSGISMIAPPYTEFYLIDIGSEFHKCRVDQYS